MSVDQITPTDTEPDDTAVEDTEAQPAPTALGQIRELFRGASSIFTALSHGSQVLALRLGRWWSSDRGPHSFAAAAVAGVVYLYPVPVGGFLAAVWTVRALRLSGEPLPVKPHQCDDPACDQCFEDDDTPAPAAAPGPVPVVDLLKADVVEAESEAAEAEPLRGILSPEGENALIKRVTEWEVAAAPAKGERGVHVAHVLTVLQQQHRMFPTWKTADLGARMRSIGIPVERQLKVAGRPLPGVRYDALQQWLGAAPQAAAPEAGEQSPAA